MPTTPNPNEEFTRPVDRSQNPDNNERKINSVNKEEESGMGDRLEIWASEIGISLHWSRPHITTTVVRSWKFVKMSTGETVLERLGIYWDFWLGWIGELRMGQPRSFCKTNH